MGAIAAISIYLTAYFIMALIFAFPIDWVISYWLEFSGRCCKSEWQTEMARHGCMDSTGKVST